MLGDRAKKREEFDSRPPVHPADERCDRIAPASEAKRIRPGEGAKDQTFCSDGSHRLLSRFGGEPPPAGKWKLRKDQRKPKWEKEREWGGGETVSLNSSFRPKWSRMEWVFAC